MLNRKKQVKINHKRIDKNNNTYILIHKESEALYLNNTKDQYFTVVLFSRLENCKLYNVKSGTTTKQSVQGICYFSPTPAILNSVRRLTAFPSGVMLVATGRESP